MERNRREIRSRTTATLAQLAQTSAHEDGDSDEESDEEENITKEQTCVQDNRLPLICLLVDSSLIPFIGSTLSSSLICPSVHNEER